MTQPQDQPDSLEFITLTTGAAEMSPRSDVDPEVLRRIRVAVGKDGVLWGGYAVRLVATTDGACVWDMVFNGEPIVRCWLAAEASGSDLAWEQAEAAAPPRVVLHRPRGVPWLAVAILPGAVPLLVANPTALMDVADAERCVAWAILTARP